MAMALREIKPRRSDSFQAGVRAFSTGMTPSWEQGLGQPFIYTDSVDLHRTLQELVVEATEWQRVAD
jgi:hypothetical protein